MSSSNKTVLVTGGAGYIGSHTCRILQQCGYEPVVYDNLSRGHRWAVQFGDLIEGDLHDGLKLADTLHKVKPLAVLHFAAYAYVGESVTDPDLYYQNNVVGSLNLLRAMQQTGYKKLVFSSTCATYGVPNTEYLDESHSQNPINPYGRTKLMMEQLLADFDGGYDFPHVCLRYFNAAGAAEDASIGEAHDPEPHLIPNVLAACADPAKQISVFGTDYDTADGSCIRDYIHVDDLAMAHVQALDYLLQGGASTAVNLGNGNGYSVLEVIEAAKKVTGKEPTVVLADRRPGDPAQLVADASKAHSLLKWQPKYPQLERMLEDHWRWFNSDLAKSL